MPAASRWLVRAALLHLLAGSTIGALLLVAKGAPALAILPWSWRGAHVEVLAVGFTLQFAMGAGTWILPRDAFRPTPMALAWLAFVLLNLGVASTAFSAATGSAAPALVGRCLEASAVAAFALHALPRVKAARLMQG